MALIIPGRTRCGLCDRTIERGAEIRAVFIDAPPEPLPYLDLEMRRHLGAFLYAVPPIASENHPVTPPLT